MRFEPLSRSRERGWGEGKSALIRPPGTFSRAREKGDNRTTT